MKFWGLYPVDPNRALNPLSHSSIMLDGVFSIYYILSKYIRVHPCIIYIGGSQFIWTVSITWIYPTTKNLYVYFYFDIAFSFLPGLLFRTPKLKWLHYHMWNLPKLYSSNSLRFIAVYSSREMAMLKVPIFSLEWYPQHSCLLVLPKFERNYENFYI